VLYDGSSHPVDSSEMAFKLAGALAFKKAAKEARPVLLEPIHEVRVRVPKGYTGEVMGDLTRRRGRILGIESEHDHEVVRAEVPLAEIRRYAVELRSLTGGRGRFVDGFVRYEEVPAPVAENIVAARRQAG
jgi:elongation factor G